MRPAAHSQPCAVLFHTCPADAVDSGSSSDNEGSSREQDGDSEDEAAGAGSDDESSAAGPSQPPNPQAVLTGRAAGGFGLEFNPVRQGVLLGGDSQGGVQLWDVSSSSGGTSSSNGGAVARIPALQVRGRGACLGRGSAGLDEGLHVRSELSTVHHTCSSGLCACGCYHRKRGQ